MAPPQGGYYDDDNDNDNDDDNDGGDDDNTMARPQGGVNMFNIAVAWMIGAEKMTILKKSPKQATMSKRCLSFSGNGNQIFVNMWSF